MVRDIFELETGNGSSESIRTRQDISWDLKLGPSSL